VEGKAIHLYSDEQRLSLAGRIKAFLQVCEAVQYLHRNSILHRDLKPGNILVSSDGVVKLLDFGIAKLVGAGSYANPNLTSAQGYMMTPNYASPEQIQGITLNAGSDIYSLGVVLYVLLTGRTPFNGLEEKMEKVAKRELPPLPSANIREDLKATETTAQLKRAMLGELDSIVLKALRYDPKDRYASAAEFAGDLQLFLDGQPVGAHRANAAQRSARALRRSRGAIAAGIVFALLTGFGAWQYRRVELQKAEVLAKESQLRGLLDQLEQHVDDAKPDPVRPGEPAKVSVPDRIQAVKKLRKAFAEDFTAIAARGAAVADREALLERALRYLDRLTEGVTDAADLTLEVADAYQELGLLQQNSAPSNVATAKAAAAQTFGKAERLLVRYEGAVSESGPVDDKVLGRIAMLRQRLGTLGARTAASPPQVTDLAVPPQTGSGIAQGSPAKSARSAEVRHAAQPTHAPLPQAVDARPPVLPQPPSRLLVPATTTALPAAVSAALQEDMGVAEARVQTAESTIAPIQASLAKQGETLNSDTLGSINRMRALLERGKRQMAAGDAAGAKDSFSTAKVYADRVLKAAGR